MAIKWPVKNYEFSFCRMRKNIKFMSLKAAAFWKKNYGCLVPKICNPIK
jgi:hypothetical protein